jgi:sugar lactone lactonase YvrE
MQRCLMALAAWVLMMHAAWAGGFEVVVPGSPFKGLHGLAFDGDGVLHGVSITGMSVYKIDPETAAVETVVGPPLGVGDDVAFAPDGTMAWTARDAVHVRDPDGTVRVVATGVNGVNSINFGPDGRLFFTLIFRADTLYEGYLDSREPRLVAEGLKGLNGFEITGDGKIIGPQFFGNAIISVDIETGEIETIAEGIQTPSAVNLLSNGDIIALGYRTGKVIRIDAMTGETRELTALEGPPIDNLAIDASDRVYISHSSHNGLTRLDPDTGESAQLIWGGLSAPGGLAAISLHGREMLLAADAWSHRTVDPETGDVNVLPVGPNVFGSTGIAADDTRIVLTNTSPAGMVQIIERGSGNAIASQFGFGAPYDVVIEPDGSILLADFAADALVRLGTDEDMTRTVVAQGLGGPVGVALDGAGHAYVTGYTDGTVRRIDLVTGDTAVVVSGLSQPEGVALLPSGKLAVADVGTQRLLIINPATGEKESAATDLPIGFDLRGAGPEPGLFTGVAVSAGGAVFISGDLDNSLVRVSAGN